MSHITDGLDLFAVKIAFSRHLPVKRGRVNAKKFRHFFDGDAFPGEKSPKLVLYEHYVRLLSVVFLAFMQVSIPIV